MPTPTDRATGSGSPTATGSRSARKTRSARARGLRLASGRWTEMRSASGRRSGRPPRRSRSTGRRRLPARWRPGSRWPASRGDRRVSGWGDGNGRAMGSSLRDPRNAGPGNAPTSRGKAGNPVETGRAKGVAHLFRATPGDRAASGSVRLHVFPRALRECDPATGRHRPPGTARARAGVPVRRGLDTGWFTTARPGTRGATGQTARHGATRCETERARLMAGTSGGGV